MQVQQPRVHSCIDVYGRSHQHFQDGAPLLTLACRFDYVSLARDESGNGQTIAGVAGCLSVYLR